MPRMGIRISPLGVFNGVSNVEQQDIALYVIEQLAKRKLAFLHISEPDWAGGPALSEAFRPQALSGVIIAAGGYSAEKAEKLIGEGYIDAVAFGRSYIANPDLVERLQAGAALTPRMPPPSTVAMPRATDYRR
jgi:N-ethylmaleimide reductase